MDARDRVLAQWQGQDVSGADMCHLAVIANGTGLMPELPSAHHSIVRMVEVPQILCPEEDGGIFKTRNALALPHILLTADMPLAGGGAFIVVSTQDPLARKVMANKGVMANPKGNAFVIYRAYHMCGVETATSILVAGLLRVPTGSDTVLPRVDAVAVARRDFKAGETMADTAEFGYSKEVGSVLIPAVAMADDSPLPFYMLEANRLAVDVPKGTVITRRMVVRPRDSVLWFLREQQDEVLLTGKPGY